MKNYLLLFALTFVLGLGGLAPNNAVAAGTPAAEAAAVGTVHLNQATAEQLQTLPGVGPALSERIISYRDEHGPFRSVDQLADVKGIGKAKLARLKSQLTVD